MSTLSIQVDDLIREKFQNATPQERVRWEEAFNLWWRVHFVQDPQEKLGLVVEYFRQKSAERGLSEEVLDDLLNDE